jgi:pimeloyl-ACP methyl ester carboxylesterase
MHTTMLRGLRFLPLAIVVASVCVDRPLAQSAVPATQAMQLKPCPSSQGAAECGAITVFENRATQRGRTIDVHFMVVRADVPAAREALFMFAGGPGQGSTGMAGTAFGMMRPVRATMDVVMVDQRGTGQSHPLACPTGAATNPAAVFGHVFDPETIARCRETLERDADLTQYTTDIAIADVDDIRAALGYDRVSVYGVSYGTRMAQAYMRRFPDRVRSAVIDGVVPFDTSVPLTYASSAQHALDLLFAACAAQSTCHDVHPHPAADLEAILARLDAGPVDATVQVRGTPVTVKMSRGDFGYALRGILYNGNGVARVAALLDKAATSKDLSEFAQAQWSRQSGFDGSIAFGQHLSVFCAEDVPFATEPEIRSATAGTFLGRYLFDEYRAGCANWPRAPIAPDARTPVTTKAPTLLVSGFFDPVTPPSFAERVAASLPIARTVVAPLGGHGSSGSCPQAAVQHVLARGTLDGMPDVCR